MMKPARMAAARMPVPVAERMLKSKTAFSAGVGLSGVGAGTTGAVRTTALCRCGTSNLGANALLSCDFTAGIPHTKTSTLKRIHGAHARRILARDGGGGGARASSAASEWTAAGCAGPEVVAPFAGFHP